MATTVTYPFSGGGFPILLTSAYQIIYAATTGVGVDNYDTLFIYGTNTSAGLMARHVRIGFAGPTGDPIDPTNIPVYDFVLAADGAIHPLIVGLIINNGTYVKAACTDSDTRVILTGYVRRTTP